MPEEDPSNIKASNLHAHLVKQYSDRQTNQWQALSQILEDWDSLNQEDCDNSTSEKHRQAFNVKDSKSTITFCRKKITFGTQEAQLVHFKDISEIKELKIAQVKDEMQRLRSANVSHEMRTPLSTVINFTDLMLMKLKNGGEINKAEFEKNFNIVKFSAMMMLNNVNDTLDKEQI